MILADILLIIGPLILCAAFASALLCFGRLIVGFGLGISMMVGPIFLSECAPVALRGQIVPCYFFLAFLGIVVSNLASIIFGGRLALMFGIAILPNVIEIILLITTQHDTPLFLAKKG